LARIRLTKGDSFDTRAEIAELLGGSNQDGIAVSDKVKAILLFANEEELYKDYFFPKGTYENCLYTGIGRDGHQDSPSNNRYSLNIDVLSHKKDRRALLVFEKQGTKYCFIGKYKLMETHQNIQPDKHGNLRRVFAFHIKWMSDAFSAQKLK